MQVPVRLFLETPCRVFYDLCRAPGLVALQVSASSVDETSTPNLSADEKAKLTKDTAAQIEGELTKEKQKEAERQRDAKLYPDGKPSKLEREVTKEMVRDETAANNTDARKSVEAQDKARQAVDMAGDAAQKHLGEPPLCGASLTLRSAQCVVALTVTCLQKSWRG